MRLLVISHTPHYDTVEGIKGWGPTVREIDWLSRLFSSITHIAILYPGNQAPESSLPYQSDKIRLRLLPPAGGSKMWEKVKILFQYPKYWKVILDELKAADMVHVRCPANISLLALIVLMIQRKPTYRWVKYAGNWDPSAKRPWSYTMQRWILRHNLLNGIVTVNGLWGDQKDHIIPFSNPSFSEKEILDEFPVYQRMRIAEPLQMLFVGRLESEKGVELIIKATDELRQRGIAVKMTFVGGGPQNNEYREMVSSMGMNYIVDFLGWFPRNEIVKFYMKAHFLLLPTTASEGWPKVISEGMAYGVVPLASNISCIQQVLTEFGCGRALPVGDVDAYVQAIQEYLNQPDLWVMESKAGRRAAANFTFEAYLQHLQQMAKKTWGLNLPQIEVGDEG